MVSKYAFSLWQSHNYQVGPGTDRTDRQKWVKSSFLFLGSFIARIGKTTGLKRGNSATTAAEGSDMSRATSPEVEDTPQDRPSTSAGPGGATLFGPSTSAVPYQQPRSGATLPSSRVKPCYFLEVILFVKVKIWFKQV